ncbi:MULTISPECIES: YpbS family protein [Paenibacillus]|uniref:YpbS family protein n=1 Tax=Paenibacillus TaxID=44249 RepID=UPI0022B908E4|nr:YpbS family protein [Paenibacillus caseinilyticus]MCZ8521773.1 YpbS family protein [Paenibacillus caseinilyticus]
MSVHEAITKHTRKQNAHLEQFLKLEELREQAIAEAVRLCSEGKPFGVEGINACTGRINAHATQGISPTRAYVTAAMIEEFVRRSR